MAAAAVIPTNAALSRRTNPILGPIIELDRTTVDTAGRIYEEEGKLAIETDALAARCVGQHVSTDDVLVGVFESDGEPVIGSA